MNFFQTILNYTSSATYYIVNKGGDALASVQID